MRYVGSGTLPNLTPQLFLYLSQSQKLLVINMAKRIYQLCTDEAKGNDQAAPMYVARYVQRVLRAISVRSGAGSPTQSPNEDGAAQGADQVMCELVCEPKLKHSLTPGRLPAVNPAKHFWALGSTVLVSDWFAEVVLMCQGIAVLVSTVWAGFDLKVR